MTTLTFEHVIFGRSCAGRKHGLSDIKSELGVQSAPVGWMFFLKFNNILIKNTWGLDIFSQV